MKIFIPALIALLSFTSQPSRAQSASITLQFVFQFKGKPLETGKTYVTAAGDSIQLDQVRFYVGDPYAVTVDDRPPEINAPDVYWLIDSKDTASLRVTFPVEANLNLAGVGFWIGVDSLNQVKGARTGALDPLKGMYWTWNSGYVAVKIEGRSISSVASSVSSSVAAYGGDLEYHLGGYRALNAVRARIILKSTAPFTIAAHSSVNLTVPVDLDRFFPASFPVKKLPTLMTPGPVAKELMKQFESCFLFPVPGKPAK